MALAIGNACLAAAHDPSKAYGQVMMLLATVTAGIIVGMGYATEAWSYYGVFGTQAIVVTLMLIPMSFLPEGDETLPEDDVNRGKVPLRPAAVIVVGIVLWHFCDNSIWGFSERIANKIGMAADMVGWLLGGGLLYGVGPAAPYLTAFVLFAAASWLIFSIPRPPQTRSILKQDWETLSAGFRYIWRERIVFGAISLDMFAVLLGGAVALMPVFARDVLELGPIGLGLLRSAPGIGAIGMAMYLTSHPINRHAGVAMFVAVGLFVSIASVIVWYALKLTIGIRVSEEEEDIGLDRAELGLEAYPEFGRGSQTFG